MKRNEDSLSKQILRCYNTVSLFFSSLRSCNPRAKHVKPVSMIPAVVPQLAPADKGLPGTANLYHEAATGILAGNQRCNVVRPKWMHPTETSESMSFPAVLGSNSHECQNDYPRQPMRVACFRCDRLHVWPQKFQNVELLHVVGTRLVVGRGTKRIFWFLKGLGWVVWGW